jgi:hypothetical protein
MRILFGLRPIAVERVGRNHTIAYGICKLQEHASYGMQGICKLQEHASYGMQGICKL